MFSHETKSNSNSQTTTEAINEIKMLQGISKTIELLIINRTEDENHENLKNIKTQNARSRNSPRHYKLSARSGKRCNSIYFDDLTEITATDAITEPSESPRSFVERGTTQLNYFKTKFDISNDVKTDGSRWLLVAPDSSYMNALKFNEHRLVRIASCDFDKKHNNNQYHNHQTLPLLRIDNLSQRDNLISPGDVIMPYIETSFTSDDQITDRYCDFLVSPDILMNQIDIKQSKKFNPDSILHTTGNNKNIQKRDFFLQNLLKVDFDKLQNESYIELPSTNVSFSTKSSSHITCQDNHVTTEVYKIDDDLSACDENKTMVDDTSISDNILYHGYMITPDFMKQIQSDKSSKLLKLSDIQNSKEISLKDKELLTLQNNDITDYSPALIIQDVSILPPDMLGNIKLKNGNKEKKFLSVQSVEDPSWNDYENIILNDDFCRENEKENTKSKTDSFRHLKMIVSDGNLQDELSRNLLESSLQNSSENYLIKNNLVRSLKEMDKKIIEMENISSVIQNNFANSEKLNYIKNSKVKKSKKSIDEDYVMRNLNQSSQLIDYIAPYNLTQTLPDIDITQISSNEITHSKKTVSQVTMNMSSKQMNYPNLNLNFIDDIKEDSMISNQIKTAVSGTSSYFSGFETNQDNCHVNIKTPYFVHYDNLRSKNRNERDQKMFLQRKRDARKLALEALNGIGLPIQSSSNILLDVINYPTPNEMMLSQIHKDGKHTHGSISQPNQENNSLSTYKTIRHVSFINKVKLQRPEITRGKNSKKAITYTDQLLALQPQHDKKRNIIDKHFISKNISANRNNLDLTPRSVISQADTEINSILTDWSIPDNVKRILNENSERDTQIYNEDLSQIQSFNSNSVIDWDQVSEMLNQHEKLSI